MYTHIHTHMFKNVMNQEQNAIEILKKKYVEKFCFCVCQGKERNMVYFCSVPVPYIQRRSTKYCEPVSPTSSTSASMKSMSNNGEGSFDCG